MQTCWLRRQKQKESKAQLDIGPAWRNFGIAVFERIIVDKSLSTKLIGALVFGLTSGRCDVIITPEMLDL